MDTSQSFLVLALMEGDTLLDSVQETCWKRQSEELFPRLIDLLKEHGLSPSDIGQIVITKGPGSYTGVRIAMTVAKVFCAMKKIPLFTLGSLQLIAGMEADVHVLMDARGHRAYHAEYRSGILQGEVEAVDLDVLKEILKEDDRVIGDGHLIGREDVWPSLAENFVSLKALWQPVDHVHLLTPDYLKPNESYLVKKR